MKILHITKKFPPNVGGDAIVVSQLVAVQSELGNQVSVFSSNYKGAKRKEYVTLIGMPLRLDKLDTIHLSRIASLIYTFFQSFTLLKNINPDVIHIHSIDLAVIFYFSARLNRKKILLTLHSGSFKDNHEHRTRERIEKTIFKLFKFENVTSVNINDLIKHKNFLYIPNGVNTTLFFKSDKSDRKKILYVGRLETEKGIRVLLQAYDRIRSEGLDVNLTIVGTGSLESEIYSFIANSKFGNDITFINGISYDKLPSIFNTSSVTILPSIRVEAFGLTLLESISCGVPVITSALSGLADEINKNSVGIILDTITVDSVSNSLKDFFTNTALREKLSMACSSFPFSRFSWEKISHDYESVYLSMQS